MPTPNLTKLKKKAAEFEQKKQFEKALQLYIQFIDESGRDLDDADLQLYNRVGDLLTRQGSVSESLAYYEKAVDMYAERGFLNNAIALCNKILRQSPARTAVYYKLGKISANKGFKSDARKNFLEYADRMQKGGQRDEALRALKEFADLCPDQDDIRLMLAEMLSKDSRNGEAIEQLEQLYSKLEAEGREAEARATMERIKAIDPDITPRASGVFQAQKSNELVFLDLGEADVRPARAGTPLSVTPLPPPEVVEKIDVTGVGALQGLTITFLPDETTPDTLSGTNRDAIPAVDGLETSNTGTDDAEVVAVPGLEGDALTLAPDEVPVSIAEATEWAGPDHVVDPMAGLTSLALSLTGEQSAIAAEDTAAVVEGLLGPDELTSVEPPIDGPISGGYDAIGSQAGLLEETPDEWVNAALGAPRDDFTFDRLLTPLENPVIAAADAAPPQEADAEPPATGSFSVDELLQLPAPVLPEFTLDAVEESETPEAFDAVADEAEEAAPAPWESSALDLIPGAAELLGDEEVDGRAVESPEALPEAVPLTSWNESAVADEVPAELAGNAVESVPLLESSTPDEGDSAPPQAIVAEAGTETMPPEFHVDAYVAAASPTPGALDLTGVRSALDMSGADTPSDVAEVLDHAFSTYEPGAAEPGTVESETPDDVPREESAVRAAFEEDRVELPLLDLEGSAQNTPPSFEATSSDLDELLSSSPSFGHDTPTAFEPEPLDLADEQTAATTDEWNAPEVLIDGEWRDEHVGGLVSGEIFVVDAQRRVDKPVGPGVPFDDLAAAMLYDGGDPEEQDGRRVPTPASPDAFDVRRYAPPQRLSFGGLEAQLRRRLELDPSDAGLRHQLGEALLDLGEREAGLAELETAIMEYELRGDLKHAREVTNVVLRVVPLSVRHHQKRVEYAARTSDRPALVEAYTELGEALFRCGQADKARVVYSRVLELSPSNESARFALGMLSQHVGLPRSSDEIPSIDTGFLSGTPSVTMVTLTPDHLAAVPDAASAPDDLPYLTPPQFKAADEGPAPADLVDDEVDAAFADEAATEREVQRRTSELEAISEWAAGQPAPTEAPAPASAQADEGFVDLGSWLRADDAPRSTRMVTTDVAPTGDEGADFAEMLRRFKEGVAESVDDEDFASHYDLGVAFKEMGLLDEAIGQFQKALRGPEHRIRAYEALGQCFVDKGQFEVARALMARALEIPKADDMTLVGVLYLLGFACERAAGRQGDAVGYYQRVFAVDISFRDVAARLAALENRPS